MAEAAERAALTEREREVVEALCRPLREHGPDSPPATNRQIADEVFLSLDAVKGHLRTIYAKLGLESLPQNEKRTRLAALGLRGELDPPPPPRERRLTRRAALVPALAGVALVLLAALALAGVVPGPLAGGDDPAPPRARAAQQAGGGKQADPPRPERSVLFDESGGLLPTEFVTEELSGVPASTMEAIETVTESAPGERREPLGRLEGEVERVKPKPAPKPAELAPAASAEAKAPARRCFNHVHRIVHRDAGHRWVWRRVRVRIPHRHVRVRQKVFMHPHTRVWRDKKGRRRERRWLHRHVRTIREPYIHWHVRHRRKRVKVGTVTRRVELKNHRHCA